MFTIDDDYTTMDLQYNEQLPCYSFTRVLMTQMLLWCFLTCHFQTTRPLKASQRASSGITDQHITYHIPHATRNPPRIFSGAPKPHARSLKPHELAPIGCITPADPTPWRDLPGGWGA
jgi:hypothetical protein